MNKKERTPESLTIAINEIKTQVQRKESEMARGEVDIAQIAKELPEVKAQLEFEERYLERLKEKIPHFDLKIYEQYKEYESVEKNIKKLEEEIHRMHKSLAMGKEFLLKTKHFIETNKLGIQRLQAELDEKLKKSKENK